MIATINYIEISYNRNIPKKGVQKDGLCRAVPTHSFQKLEVDINYSSFSIGKQNFDSLRAITSQEIVKNRDQLLIVDPRQFYEYRILHIKDSIHVPLSSIQDSLIKKLIALGKVNGIFFYADSPKSSIAHRATLKSLLLGHKNTFFFEKGIFNWACKPPELLERDNLLLDKISGNPLFRMLKENKNHSITLIDFQEKVEDQNYMLVGIRPIHKRKDPLVCFKNQQVLSFDEIVLYIHTQNSFLSKYLLIYDTDIHQCLLLHSYLKENGNIDFYFLKGGFLNSANQYNSILKGNIE
jgi:rhodanese-related sulfurtransferase